MIREGLTFDDVLLEPQHSTVKSRSKVDLSVKWDNLHFAHPIIPANMKTVTGKEMVDAVTRSNGLAILHRFMPLEDQFAIADEITNLGNDSRCNHFAVSVGVKQDDFENIEKFVDFGVHIFCIDIAHGDSQQCSDMIKHIREKFPWAFIIAGNIASGWGARRLWEAGADIVKVGVGPGSLCTTRIETGNGVPQLTALIDVFEVKQELLALDRTRVKSKTRTNYAFIADGGIKNAGDIVKALCFADMVMIGNLFAGCEESPGNRIVIDGICHKEYVGSSTHKTNHIEGVAAFVPCKGSYQQVLTKLLEGVRSGCSYQGAHNLTELKDNPTFIRITNAGLKESHPHDIILK
jgi:IMP dehydrogenase